MKSRFAKVILKKILTKLSCFRKLNAGLLPYPPAALLNLCWKVIRISRPNRISIENNNRFLAVKLCESA